MNVFDQQQSPPWRDAVYNNNTIIAALLQKYVEPIKWVSKWAFIKVVGWKLALCVQFSLSGKITHLPSNGRHFTLQRFKTQVIEKKYSSCRSWNRFFADIVAFKDTPYCFLEVSVHPILTRLSSSSELLHRWMHDVDGPVSQLFVMILDESFSLHQICISRMDGDST